MTDTDEQKLVAKVIQGDTASFNRLVLAYQQPVYNLALRLMGDPDEAADVAQETFLSAYKSIKSYRGGSLKAWLYRIATNCCYDQLRSKKRHRLEAIDDRADEMDLLERPSTLVHRDQPEDYAINRELASELQAGLDLLPYDQRVALVLCDVQGLSYDQIAEIMDCEMGTVRSRISRGRAKMRDYLLAKGELLPQSFRH